MPVGVHKLKNLFQAILAFQCAMSTLFATYAIYLISNWLLVEIKGKFYHTHTHILHTKNTRENVTWSQDFVWNKQCSEINTFYNFQGLSKS